MAIGLDGGVKSIFNLLFRDDTGPAMAPIWRARELRIRTSPKFCCVIKFANRLTNRQARFK